MQGAERPRAQQVLNDIYNAYAVSCTYALAVEPPCIGISYTAFASHRRRMISPLVEEDLDTQKIERDSFMCEWMTLLGFKNIINNSGLTVELAPPELEMGLNGRKGSDLIISREIPGDGKQEAVLAINVKLKRLGRKTDMYRYDAVLCCPAIELTLGDFSVQTRESENMSIIPWLRQVAIPNLTQSGKIPYFPEWQNYLISRVDTTISHYTIKINDYLRGDYWPSEQEANLFPKEESEFTTFYEKLTSAYLLFQRLRTNSEVEDQVQPHTLRIPIPTGPGQEINICR